MYNASKQEDYKQVISPSRKNIYKSLTKYTRVKMHYWIIEIIWNQFFLNNLVSKLNMKKVLAKDKLWFFLSNIIVNIKKKMWKSYFGYKHSTGKSWILIDCKDCWFHSYLNEAKIGNNVRLWKYSNDIVLTTLFCI